MNAIVATFCALFYYIIISVFHFVQKLLYYIECKLKFQTFLRRWKSRTRIQNLCTR